MTHLAGHEAVYTEKLAHTVGENGLSALIHYPAALGAPSFAAPSRETDFPAPVDARGLAGRIGRFLAERQRRKAFASLYAAMGPDDAALIHTADFASLLSAMAAKPPQGRLALICRFDHYDEPGAIEALKRIADQARTSGTALLTDSASLSADFSALTGYPFRTVAPPTEFTREVETKDAPVFGFFGGGRPQKGFERLPGIIEAIRGLLPEARFLIQYYPHPDDPPGSAQDALTRLRAMEGVEIVEGFTAPAVHEHMVRRCVAVLLPYDRKVYRRVTSGIFVEALASGAAALVPQASWMANETEQHGLERALVLDFHDPDAIARAAVEAGTRHSRAAPNIERWAAGHSYDALFRAVCEALSWPAR
jgi:glycosyltransferase involved in cell wall biosynthesis